MAARRRGRWLLAGTPRPLGRGSRAGRARRVLHAARAAAEKAPARPADADFRDHGNQRHRKHRSRQAADRRAARARLPLRARRFRQRLQLIPSPEAPAGGLHQDRRPVRARQRHEPGSLGQEPERLGHRPFAGCADEPSSCVCFGMRASRRAGCVRCARPVR